MVAGRQARGGLIPGSHLDFAPDGRQARPLSAGDSGAIEREPAWSPDGARLAFAARKDSGFDIVVASVRTGTALVVAAMPGDERWPSWTPDGRLVFAHRSAPPPGREADASRQWELYLALPVRDSDSWQTPVPLTATADSETWPRVSPDGTRLAFVSERDAEDDVDLWWMPMPGCGRGQAGAAGDAPASSHRGHHCLGAQRRRDPAASYARRLGAGGRGRAIVGSRQPAPGLLRRA